MTPENEQLKALAEAAKNANSLAAKEYRAFNTYATPERILALIAENERLRLALREYGRAGVGQSTDHRMQLSAWRLATAALGETK